jgi:hypothetical protein
MPHQHGTALRMKCELAELARRFGTPPPVPHVEPPLPNADGPMVLSGLASVPVVDLERVRFRKHSLSWLPWKLPVLQYRHGPTVGEITSLMWTDDGLAIVCNTDHPLAKLCGAFSITATIHKFELKNTGSPDYYAEASGWLESVSLVSQPANPKALVMHRYPQAPHVELYRSLAERIGKVRRMVQQLEFA